MKKLVFLSVIVLLLSSFHFVAYAHPGSLDEKGGHYDSSTGKYHYHHGYPAHLHTNGQCPYDFDDQTNREYNPSQSTNSTTGKMILENSYTLWDHITNIATAIGVSAMLGLLILLVFLKQITTSFKGIQTSVFYDKLVFSSSFLCPFTCTLSSIYNLFGFKVLLFWTIAFFLMYQWAKAVYKKQTK